MINLQNESVLITGGSKGLGRAIVNALVAHGAKVTAIARNKALLKEMIGANVSVVPGKHLTTLKELTNAAVFVASDEGSAITGTILNLTAGMIVE